MKFLDCAYMEWYWQSYDVLSTFSIHYYLRQVNEMDRWELNANRTSNLIHVFPGTVRTWPRKIFPKGGVFNNLLGGDMHSHERLLVVVVTSTEGGYVLGLSVCLSVCLPVCPQDYSKKSWTDFDENFCRVGRGPRTNWLEVGGNPVHDPDTEIF